ncbi:FkbM family methyltransferase, partial [Candidatus Auribacterota bacterium]
VAEVLDMDVDCLDNQLANSQIEDVDFIKLDAQGSELAILEGSTKTLNNVWGVEVEVEFTKLYKDQPLFADVDNFLRQFGFQLFDLRPFYWKRKHGKKYGRLKGQIIFADALYLLDINQLHSRLSDIRDDFDRKAKFLKAISIAILYGYVDYAAALFKEKKDFFNEAEIQTFYRVLERGIPLSVKIPYFRGRARVAKLFKNLYWMFRLHTDHWAISGESLGNLD